MAAVSGLTLLIGTTLGHDAGLGGVEISAPVAAVSFATDAPTVAISVAINAPAAAVSFASDAPTVALSVVVEPPAAAVSFATAAPTVALSVVVEPPARDISIVAQPPSLILSVGIEPPVRSIAFVGQPPTISIPAGIVVPAATVSFAGQPPTVPISLNVLVPAASVAISAPAPEIGVPVLITPPAAVVSFAPRVPSFLLLAIVYPPAAVVSFSAGAPTAFVQSDDYAVYDSSVSGTYHLDVTTDAVPRTDGSFTVFSRQYGRTYGHVDVYPANPDGNVVVPTAADPLITLGLVDAADLASKVSLVVGDVSHDLGNGLGPRLYAGTIALSSGCTLHQAYQYLQFITRRGSQFLVGGVPGERYRRLRPYYAENPNAPFGVYVGNVFYVAQGWRLVGALPAESDMYRLIADDGTVQIPPSAVTISVGNLVAGDRLLVARVSGGELLRDEYTPIQAGVGLTSLSVQEPIKLDTPFAGTLRVRGRRYEYAGVDFVTKTFGGLSPPLVVGVSPSDDMFVPLIDRAATTTSESVSVSFIAPFEVDVSVRNGGAAAIVPFSSRALVTSAGANVLVSRTPDV
jgi:hypothetical protein